MRGLPEAARVVGKGSQLVKSDLPPGGSPELRRALGTFDLILLNIAAIVGLRWLSTAAQLGTASLTLWLIAFIVFFVPSALTVQELSSRIPHVGGLYRWTQAAFGETHGFLAGWAYWLSNLVYFPSLLLFVSGVTLHLAGRSWLPLAESPVYNGLFCLGLLWSVTFLNMLGLRARQVAAEYRRPGHDCRWRAGADWRRRRVVALWLGNAAACGATGAGFRVSADAQYLRDSDPGLRGPRTRADTR